MSRAACTVLAEHVTRRIGVPQRISDGVGIPIERLGNAWIGHDRVRAHESGQLRVEPSCAEVVQSLAAGQAGLVILTCEMLGRNRVEGQTAPRAVGKIEVLDVQYAVAGNQGGRGFENLAQALLRVVAYHVEDAVDSMLPWPWRSGLL